MQSCVHCNLWAHCAFWFQDGCTPLMVAAKAGEVDCMRVLVKELGCNKDAQDKVTVYILYAGAHARVHPYRCIQVCAWVLMHIHLCTTNQIMNNIHAWMVQHCMTLYILYRAWKRWCVSLCMECIVLFVQNGLTAVHCALKRGPAVVKVLLNEFLCNPKLLTTVSDLACADCLLLMFITCSIYIMIYS